MRSRVTCMIGSMNHLTDCIATRDNCKVRYPSKNVCKGLKHCKCWDKEKGCLGIYERLESY